jgi:hypothetical protein
MQTLEITEREDGSAIVDQTDIDWIPGLTKGLELSPEETLQTLAELKSPKKDTTLGLTTPKESKVIQLKAGVDIHPYLDWNQVLFIQNKVIGEKTLAKAKKFYTGKSHVCVFGRNYARAIYESTERQEAYIPVEQWDKPTAKQPKIEDAIFPTA